MVEVRKEPAMDFAHWVHTQAAVAGAGSPWHYPFHSAGLSDSLTCMKHIPEKYSKST